MSRNAIAVRPRGHVALISALILQKAVAHGFSWATTGLLKQLLVSEPRYRPSWQLYHIARESAVDRTPSSPKIAESLKLVTPSGPSPRRSSDPPLAHRRRSD